MLDKSVMLYGENRELPEVHVGHAGPVSFEFVDLMVRHIRLDDVELARRIYFAVRSPDWDVFYPTALRDLHVDATSDSFHATWVAHYGQIGYECSGEIVGKPNGTLCFDVVGRALKDVEAPRIGLNLLLPTDICAGKMFELTGQTVPQGPIRYHEFTRLVPRTTIATDFDSIRFCPEPGLDVKWIFGGANADMEDQRNWAEATYKAFAALQHPYPHLPRGHQRSQRICLTFPTRMKRRRHRRSLATKISVGRRIPGCTVPRIGVDLPQQLGDLSEHECRLLVAMQLAYLRINLQPVDRAIRVATQLNCPLMIHMQNHKHDMAASLSALRAAGAKVSYLEYAGRIDAVSLTGVREVARAAGIKSPLGGPAAADFSRRAELRDAMDAGADFVSWGVSPNVHQEDDQTYLENTRGVPAQLKLVHHLAPDARVVMGPVSIIPRFRRERTDARQAGLILAAYAAGLIKVFSECDTDAATFFHAVGSWGVIHRRTANERSAFDCSDAPQVYPAYHVLRETGRLRGAKIRRVNSSNPLAVEAMAVDGDGRQTLMLVNKSEYEQEVEVAGLTRRSADARARVLDTTSFDEAREATALPERAVAVRNGRFNFHLGSYAVMWVVLT